MQTFITDDSFAVTARSLDMKRLGKQRVEAWQILNVLRGVDNEGNPKEAKGWVNHPAVKMWRGNEAALADYGICMCLEWISRGYNDSLLPRFKGFVMDHGYISNFPSYAFEITWWDRLVDRDAYPLPEDTVMRPSNGQLLMATHQSNLVRKNPGHYSRHFSFIPDDLPYYWPVS